jgi:GTP-binding protein
MIAAHEPPLYRGKRIKYYYLTQVGIKPPTFIAFVNHPEAVHFSYLRYIENSLRDAFGFRGTPLRLFTKRRREERSAEKNKGLKR